MHSTHIVQIINVSFGMSFSHLTTANVERSSFTEKEIVTHIHNIGMEIIYVFFLLLNAVFR